VSSTDLGAERLLDLSDELALPPWMNVSVDAGGVTFASAVLLTALNEVRTVVVDDRHVHPHPAVRGRILEITNLVVPSVSRPASTGQYRPAIRRIARPAAAGVHCGGS
jgi:hypothetical protein